MNWDILIIVEIRFIHSIAQSWTELNSGRCCVHGEMGMQDWNSIDETYLFLVFRSFPNILRRKYFLYFQANTEYHYNNKKSKNPISVIWCKIWNFAFLSAAISWVDNAALNGPPLIIILHHKFCSFETRVPSALVNLYPSFLLLRIFRIPI